MGWSAGLQEHPGEIKEHFDAILPTVTRVWGFFLPYFCLLFLETAEITLKKGLVGLMPFGRAPSMGERLFRWLQHWGKAGLPDATEYFWVKTC